MSNLPIAWTTPEFSTDDPLIPRTMQLRPSLWAVVFAVLEEAARPWNWFQDDPAHATVQEVVFELIQARTVLERGPSMYIGEIREFATADPPEGWLRCDGALVADIDYPLLGAVIHAGYRDDADHFFVPDRNRRYGIDGVYPHDIGGEETHAQTVAEMANHFHAASITPVTSLAVFPGEEPAVIALIAGVTDDAGSSEPFNVMNPYEGTQFYIRASWPTA